jgi:hypothetical protein
MEEKGKFGKHLTSKHPDLGGCKRILRKMKRVVNNNSFPPNTKEVFSLAVQ